MIRYIHGSADSTDLDVVYVFDELPSFADCQRFCSSDPRENRNIIVIEDGVVTRCFKGNTDEVNNAVRATWPLHEQEHPLLITRPIPRDVFLKDITATRKVLSPLTTTPLRPKIKAAIRGDWDGRVQMLKSLQLSEIDFSRVARWPESDLLKSIAFQIGQAFGLHQGAELYTKADIAAHFPLLRPYLYRNAQGLTELQTVLTAYAEALSAVETQTLPDGSTRIVSSGAVYDIHQEVRLR